MNGIHYVRWILGGCLMCDCFLYSFIITLRLNNANSTFMYYGTFHFVGRILRLYTFLCGTAKTWLSIFFLFSYTLGKKCQRVPCMFQLHCQECRHWAECWGWSGDHLVKKPGRLEEGYADPDKRCWVYTFPAPPSRKASVTIDTIYVK